MGDHTTLSYLSQQLHGNRKFLPECMEWMKKNIDNPFERCIWVSLNIADKTNEKYKIRGNFINKDPTIVFQK